MFAANQHFYHDSSAGGGGRHFAKSRGLPRHSIQLNAAIRIMTEIIRPSPSHPQPNTIQTATRCFSESIRTSRRSPPSRSGTTQLISAASRRRKTSTVAPGSNGTIARRSTSSSSTGEDGTGVSAVCMDIPALTNICIRPSVMDHILPTGSKLLWSNAERKLSTRSVPYA